MEFIQRSIELKWPILLFEVVFLIGGIILITSRIKMRKQSRATALFSLFTGIVITLVSLYFLLITFILGYNS